MFLDFETLLVLLTLLTGVIWAWDKWRSRRQPESSEESKPPWWLDLSRSLFPVILAVLVIRSFIVEPFRIPSGSMEPTLLPGDFILVNKFDYGLRLPVLHNRVLGNGSPQRGDVVVFRYPVDPAQDYIKRVIGLPGDRVRYMNKRVYINGELMDQEVVGPYPEEPGAQLRHEMLPDTEHPILIHNDGGDRGFTFEVPPGNYFMMGDNRDRSSDSRFWGPVPEENLVGSAFLIWMSWSSDDNSVSWSRIGDSIR